MELMQAALARPAVRVNQVGYLVDGPKAATVVTDAPEPLPVALEGTDWVGRTVPAGTDSGLPVHTVDFTAVRAAGRFRLRAGDRVSRPFAIGPDPYAGLLADAVGFLYAQRSGAAVLAEARWQLDWLLRMQVPAGEQHAGLAFHRVHDDAWTPLPLLPHLDPAPRFVHRPSTGAGLHLAAAAAHAARLVDDPRLLPAARTGWAAARAEPDLRAPDDAGAHGGGPYHDDDLADDVAWAAAELFLATGDPAYRPVPAGPPRWVEFDDLAAWTAIELAVHAPGLGTGPAVLARADELLALQAAQPWGQPYAPGDGWDWGSTGRILGGLLILAAAHRLTDAAAYRAGALRGLDYVFGRNPVGLSYVTGWGTETAHRQRVRHFGHALDPAYPPPPRGSVAGGPASKHYPGFPGDPRFAGLPDQLCHVDEPTSETTNDVCIRWNAPLALPAAWL